MTLYQRVLGKEFADLDGSLARLHSLQGRHRMIGLCTITGADRWIGRCLAALLGLPLPTQATLFAFEIDADENREIWIRHFPRRIMLSRLYVREDGLLGEKIGPARLAFRIESRSRELHMHLVGIRVLGIAWPTRWLPRVWAVERGDGSRFHFDVGADLGRFGLLVAYSGHLDLTAVEASA